MAKLEDAIIAPTRTLEQLKGFRDAWAGFATRYRTKGGPHTIDMLNAAYTTSRDELLASWMNCFEIRREKEPLDYIPINDEEVCTNLYSI